MRFDDLNSSQQEQAKARFLNAGANDGYLYELLPDGAVLCRRKGGKRITEKDIQRHLRRTGATSIGDVERLAGIDTTSRQDRMRIWGSLESAFKKDTQEGIDAAMLKCRKMTAALVNGGLLSLWPAAAGNQ